MKIGIVSFYHSQENYGQILQCYALQKIFRDMGHDVFHLRYNNNRSLQSRVKRIIKIIMDGLPYTYLNLYIKKRYTNKKNNNTGGSSISNKQRGFDDFRRKYIKFSDSDYSIDELASNPPEADVWVAGSDQIWQEPSELYHLTFAPMSSKRIAYAASMGGCKLSNKYNKFYFKKYLKDFDYIGLREKDGVEECKALGFSKTELNLDPTLLLCTEAYRNISHLPIEATNKKYVFVYLLGNPIDIKVSAIESWVKQAGYEMIYVASQGREDDHFKLYPNPQEWLALIDHAECVITNSFHGMVFSIIFNKRFMVIPLCDNCSRMNSRLSTTLEELEISKDIISGDFSKIEDSIDYTHINKNINDIRNNTIKELSIQLEKK